LLAVWRRVLREGGGPELTLPEAAVLLGTSVESVRRRIKAGQIRAFHDERGRVRIVATVTPPEGISGVEPEEQPQELGRLWQELKDTRRDLDLARAEMERLRQELGLAGSQASERERDLLRAQEEVLDLTRELEAAREALQHTQDELASLWRVMASRRERAGVVQRFGVTDGNEAFDLRVGASNMAHERERIQAQIDRVRDLSRRRRWPWPQVS
jgi:seryl-tRNA synthetase